MKTLISKLGAVLGTCLVLFSISAHAVIIPFGVQTNVSLNTVVNTWGWTQCYQAFYGTTLGGTHALVTNQCTGDHIMLAGRRTDTPDNLIALAATTTVDAILNVGNGANAHHLSNGAEWYYSPNFSWGFAGGGDSTSRGQCDTSGVNGDKRLCWHTIGGVGGWRIGVNTGLNQSTVYEKLAFMANAVPEPATLALLGLGLAGIGFSRRRQTSKVA